MAQQHIRLAVITRACEGVQTTFGELTNRIPHFDSFRLWHLVRIWQTCETPIAICDSHEHRDMNCDVHCKWDGTATLIVDSSMSSSSKSGLKYGEWAGKRECAAAPEV